MTQSNNKTTTRTTKSLRLPQIDKNYPTTMKITCRDGSIRIIKPQSIAMRQNLCNPTQQKKFAQELEPNYKSYEIS